MNTISLSYKKIPLLIQYEATRTRDLSDPYDVAIEKICVRGTTHDLYDIIREVDLAEMADQIVSAILENEYENRHLEDEEKL